MKIYRLRNGKEFGIIYYSCNFFLKTYNNYMLKWDEKHIIKRRNKLKSIK